MIRSATYIKPTMAVSVATPESAAMIVSMILSLSVVFKVN